MHELYDQRLCRVFSSPSLQRSSLSPKRRQLRCCGNQMWCHPTHSYQGPREVSSTLWVRQTTSCFLSDLFTSSVAKQLILLHTCSQWLSFQDGISKSVDYWCLPRKSPWSYFLPVVFYVWYCLVWQRGRADVWTVSWGTEIVTIEALDVARLPVTLQKCLGNWRRSTHLFHRPLPSQTLQDIIIWSHSLDVFAESIYMKSPHWLSWKIPNTNHTAQEVGKDMNIQLKSSAVLGCVYSFVLLLGSFSITSAEVITNVQYSLGERALLPPLFRRSTFVGF